MLGLHVHVHVRRAGGITVCTAGVRRRPRAARARADDSGRTLSRGYAREMMIVASFACVIGAVAAAPAGDRVTSIPGIVDFPKFPVYSGCAPHRCAFRHAFARGSAVFGVAALT